MPTIAWLGAGAFAVSLAYLVYFYAVTLGEPGGEPAAQLPHALIDVGLFAVFALHHSAFARASAKRWITGLVAASSERTLYVWISSLLLAAVCALWQPVAGVAYDLRGAARLAGYGVQAAGVWLTMRGAGVIGALDLAGVRQATGRRPLDALKIAGPFRVVRHPIYLGWMLMVFGAPTMTNNRLLFAAVSSLYLILAIPWEERSLVAAHGDQYRAYQRLVRWRVVPGIW